MRKNFAQIISFLLIFTSELSSLCDIERCRLHRIPWCNKWSLIWHHRRVMDTPAHYCSWSRETLAAVVKRVVVPHCLNKRGVQKSLYVLGTQSRPRGNLLCSCPWVMYMRLLKLAHSGTVVLVYTHPHLWCYKLFNEFCSTLRGRIFVLNTSTVILYLTLSSIPIVVSSLSMCILILRSVRHDS
jgi:hypothetical protein